MAAASTSAIPLIGPLIGGVFSSVQRVIEASLQADENEDSMKLLKDRMEALVPVLQVASEAFALDPEGAVRSHAACLQAMREQLARVCQLVEGYDRASSKTMDANEFSTELERALNHVERLKSDLLLGYACETTSILKEVKDKINHLLNLQHITSEDSSKIDPGTEHNIDDVLPIDAFKRQ